MVVPCAHGTAPDRSATSWTCVGGNGSTKERTSSRAQNARAGPITSISSAPSYSRMPISMVLLLSCRRGRAEAAAVLGGGHAQGADEDPPHRLWRAEAAAPGHGFNALPALLQPAAGGLQSNSFHVAGRSHAQLGPKRTGEMTRAHRRPQGHRLDGQLLAGV